jgi:hypothetical protein
MPQKPSFEKEGVDIGFAMQLPRTTFFKKNEIASRA